jgi:hypothetical protein
LAGSRPPERGCVAETSLQRIWEKAGAEAWQSDLIRNEAGQVTAGLANAALALRQAPDFSGLVCYDEMLRHTLLVRPAPDSRLPRITAVLDYLNGLLWDRTPRIDKWLSYYLEPDFSPMWLGSAAGS